MNKEEMSNSSDEEYLEPVPKKIKTEWCKSYSNKAMQMMCKMGYVTDKGLGKQGQGRLEPIEAIQQEGRRGFGLKFNVLNSHNLWEPNSENILIPEHVTWLECPNLSHSLKEMRQWMVYGPKKESLLEETFFCDPEILKAILDSKSVFNELNSTDMRKARSRSNPFETIRSSIFQNRAAVKMANIDSLCNFMFTNPRDKLGKSIVSPEELIYFADICAGPGGFSEYILFRKSWEAKGFGFTLRGANDFKLDKFLASSPESFDPFYGVKDDGNIFDQSNQQSFSEYIFKHCKLGVHFVMADGGFSVEGQENIQEILSKQLYLCQCLTALSILRDRGHFVCKLFDTFTQFTVGLIYLMSLCFEHISICKPNTSRPANSERYLICKWKKPNTDVLIYLNDINMYLNTREENGFDINEIVSCHVLSQNEEFLKYVVESNNLIGKNQIIGLKKIASFCQNPQLKETRQAEIRKQCLNIWNLPDKLRHAPEVKSTETILKEILDNWYFTKTFLSTTSLELTYNEMLHNHIESIYDWYFVPIGRGETSINACSIFLCRSRGNLLKFTENRKWEPVEYIFEVSPKSLFYGEIVYEYSGEGRTQTRVCGLHIIDAIMLGGKDIRRLRLQDRVKMCEKFAKSVNKPHKGGNVNKTSPIRSKRLLEFKDIETFFNNMSHYNLKDNSVRLGFAIDSDNFKQQFFVPGGILMFCEISNFFFSKMSKSTNSLYYFDKRTQCSHYLENMPKDIQNILFASFRNSFCRRLLWKWTNTMQVEKHCSKKEQGILYRDDVENFVLNK